MFDPVSAGIIGGATLLSGGLQYLGSQDQARAAQHAADAQNQQYYQNREDMMPWTTAGKGAVNQLSEMMKTGGQLTKMPNAQFTMQDFQQDPGYKWRMQEGVNALAASGAAAGNYGSGNMGIAIQRYGQNLASDEYQNAYQRWADAYNRTMGQQDTIYNRLAGISGTGMTGQTDIGHMGQNAAAGAGNAGMIRAGYGAQGYQDVANTFNTGLNRGLTYGYLQNNSPGDWSMPYSYGPSNYQGID